MAAQAQISNVLGRDDRRYHAVALDGGFHLANPPHQLAAEFDSAGVAVRSGTATWGLHLRGYGYGGDLGTVDPVGPFALDNRVEYQRELLNEWYVNGPSGIEQGFTVEHAPGARTGEPLTLAFHTSGNVTTTIDSTGTIAVVSRADGTAALRYRGLTAYDATGRELRAWLAVDERTLLIHVDDTRAQYPLLIDPFIEQAVLMASDGAAGDLFGAVALDGDTIVVGAWMDDVGPNVDQGSAYVFVKPAAGWSGLLTEQARLIASDGAARDAFGIAVSIDGETIVVGASSDDISDRTDQGSAYVFVKPADGWTGILTESAKLTASGGSRQDVFGEKVAIDGDTIVVGARGDDVGGGCFGCTFHGDRGSAFVFVRPAAGWSGNLTQNATLNPGSFLFADQYQFGSSVAISGDTIVVGAWDVANCQGCGGDAYVFVKPATGWSGTRTETARLRASDAVFADHFGISVAIGSDTIVVGAFHDDTGTKTNHGSAYVFVKPAEGWSGTRTQNAKLTASDGAAGDEFGVPVGMSGNTIVVAARLDDIGANVDQGSVYVFTEPAGGWSGALTEDDKFTAADGAASDFFGNGLAFRGSAVVVGAPLRNNGPNADQGSAYVFVTNDADLSLTKVGSPNSVTAGDNVTYTLTLTNNGPISATDITVSDDLPGEVTFVSCAATDGGVCSGSGNSRTVMFPSLASGASATMTIVANVRAAAAGGTTVSNTASVGSFTPDSNGGNNSSTALTLVESADDTPPAIESHVTPAPNAAGWHNSPPTVTWSVADPESGIATSTGCDQTTVNVDTTELVLTCTATNGTGVPASASVAIRLDTVAPTIIGSRTPAVNANGWNNTDVTVSFDCNDERSGVSNCTPAQTVTAEGSGQSATGTVHDAAGNEATAVIGGINIDKTQPTITAHRTPVANAFGWNNTDVTVDFTCADELSGVTTEPAEALLGEGANQNASASCADAAGNSGSLTVGGINVDKTPPIATGTPNRLPDSTGWYNHGFELIWSASDVLSGVAGCGSAGQYTGPDTGSDGSALNGTCTDRAGNEAQGTFRFRYDASAPNIEAARTPAPNAAGWNNTDVTVDFSCTDASSGVTSQPADATLAAGGANQSVSGECQDIAGNTASLVVGGINIDKTAPVVVGTPGRTPGANGWYNHTFEVSWSSVDALSGSGLCSAPSSYSGPDTAAGVMAGECADRAGNVGHATFAFSFDATPPSITIARPVDGAAFVFRQPAAASYTCIDAMSGVAGCAGPVASGATLNTNVAGAQTFTVTAMDVAGNTAALTHQYSVGYGFEGFFAPLNNLPTTNRGPAGRTFPVKFALRDAGGGFIADPAAIISVGIMPAACGTQVADLDGEETTVDTGGLTYDPLTGVWHFKWQTTKSHGGCWVLEVRLADGSVHAVAFELR